MNSKHLRKACGTYLKEESALCSSVFIWALQLIKVSNSWESLEMYKSILKMLMAFVSSAPLKSKPTYLLTSYPALVDSRIYISWCDYTSKDNTLCKIKHYSVAAMLCNLLNQSILVQSLIYIWWRLQSSYGHKHNNLEIWCKCSNYIGFKIVGNRIHHSWAWISWGGMLTLWGLEDHTRELQSQSHLVASGFAPSPHWCSLGYTAILPLVCHSVYTTPWNFCAWLAKHPAGLSALYHLQCDWHTTKRFPWCLQDHSGQPGWLDTWV